MMPAQRWRERREAYLREHGRLADLIAKGTFETGWRSSKAAAAVSVQIIAP
jgi:hypothetical protein